MCALIVDICNVITPYMIETNVLYYQHDNSFTPSTDSSRDENSPSKIINWLFMFPLSQVDATLRQRRSSLEFCLHTCGHGDKNSISGRHFFRLYVIVLSKSVFINTREWPRGILRPVGVGGEKEHCCYVKH